MSDIREGHLVETAVFAALGRREELRDRLERAVADGVERAALREVLLQVLPYAGFPRALSALLVLAEVVPDGDALEEEADADLRARGEAVFRAVYGDAADPILERIRSAHPALPDWILEDAYGKVLARGGLDLPEREVLGVALLTALDQPDQLQGHLRGGRRVGASSERLRAAVETACRHVDDDVAARARARLEREFAVRRPAPPA